MKKRIFRFVFLLAFVMLIVWLPFGETEVDAATTSSTDMQSRSAASPRVQYWISDTEYGDTPSDYKVGNTYYFCYRFYDSTSGKNWDEIEDSNYTINLTFYNPDGSVKYTNQNAFDYDQSWISSFFTEPGTYTAKIIMSGDYKLEGTRTFTVKENPIKVNCPTTSISLILGGTESQTIYPGYTGYYNGDWVISYSCSNSNISCTWGAWTDDHRSPLTIKAKATGSTIVTISIKDEHTKAVLDSTTVTVTVVPKEYTVRYDANGGSEEPGNQTKYHNTTLTLSSTRPIRPEYTFLGWSISSTATSATYQPGDDFTSNKDTTLYAVWKFSAKAISANSAYSAVISTGGDIKYYTYTPTASGKYVIYSTGSGDTKVFLYNASGTQLDSDDDDGESTNFRLEYNLTAGTTYTFGVKYYNSSKTGTISFKFGKIFTVTYHANEGSGEPSPQYKDYGTDITLSSEIPTRSNRTFLGWATSSTATSATYQPGDNFDIDSDTTLYAVWGFSAKAISANSDYSAVISTGGEIKYYTYTPTASGKYVIYSTGSGDTKVFLYNASGTQLDSDDDDGESTNFRLEYNLTAGTTYIFGVKYYNSSKTGTISFKFGKIFTITYHANGGAGAPSLQYKDYGTDITLSSEIPTRSGRIFLGWSASSTTKYQPGDGFNIDSDTTLYAVWNLSIIIQARGVCVANGETAAVKVTAVGDGLTYRWYYKDKGMDAYKFTSSFKGNTYSITMTDERAGRSVLCKVYDKYGNMVQSKSALLSQAVRITKQPTNVCVANGKTAKVTVKAVGEGLIYRWYFKEAGASSYKYTSSFTGSTYSVIMNDARTGRRVLCKVYDKYGNEVQSKSVVLSQAVRITKQPVSVTVAKGSTAKVSLTAKGDGLTYKWYFKDAGASEYKYTSSFKGNTYSVSMSSARNGRRVLCMVYDKYGNKVQSNTVILKMK